MITLAIVILALVLLPVVWPHRWLVRDGKRYLLRWPLLGGDGLKRAPFGLGREGDNLFLHLIIRSDGPAVHSHPWWARCRILIGRYADMRQYRLPMFDRERWLKHGELRRTYEWSAPSHSVYGPGDSNFLDEGAFHTIQLITPFALTLCRTGVKHGRGWHFKVGDKIVSASGLGAAAYDEAQDVGRT